MRSYQCLPLSAIPDTRVRRDAAKLVRSLNAWGWPHGTALRPTDPAEMLAAAALVDIGRARLKFWGRGLVGVYLVDQHGDPLCRKSVNGGRR